MEVKGGTVYKDAYELIDLKKAEATNKTKKLSRRRPVKTFRIVATVITFVLAVIAFILIVAFKVDTSNKINSNQDFQSQLNEEASNLQSQQSNFNDEFEELLYLINNNILSRLNDSNVDINVLQNKSNSAVRTLESQLSQKIQDIQTLLNVSNSDILTQLLTAKQTLQNKLNSTNQELQFEQNRETKNREAQINSAEANLQIQLNETSDVIQSLTLHLEQQVQNIESKISNFSDVILSQLNSSTQDIHNTLSKLQCPGLSRHSPASNCQQVFNCNPSFSTGDYWILAPNNRTILSVYCERSCGNPNDGWRRVAFLDSGLGKCPTGLQRRFHLTDGQFIRQCGASRDERCSSVIFETNITQYDKVCGKIIAYQFGIPDGFRGNATRNNAAFLDGVTLRLEGPQANHIWSFGATAYNNVRPERCPCDQTNITVGSVGTDYFCDGAETSSGENNFIRDRLWDGASCNPTDSRPCCQFNNPPWFFKQLASPTTADIQMRVCIDEPRSDEDIRIEQLEIYVQ